MSLNAASKIRPLQSVAVLLVVFWLFGTAGRPQNSTPAGQDSEASPSPRIDVARDAKSLLALSASQNFANHTLALHTAQQALSLYQSLADQAGVARSYSQIGRCYMAQSDLNEATTNYELARQIWRGLGNTSELAEGTIMLGFLEFRKGEWPRAVELLTQAQNLISEQDHPVQMGQIAGGLGEIFSNGGLPDEALIQFQRALDFYRQTPDTRDDAMIIDSLGNTYYQLGKYPEAKDHFQQALTLVAPDSIDAATFRTSLGRVCAATGDYGAAISHLQFALEFFTRSNNPIEAAQVRGLLGQACQQQGDLNRARQYYQQAITTFTALADKLNLAATYYALGRLEMKQGNYAVAEGCLRESITATEDVRHVATSSDLTAAFSATIHDRYESYIECLMQKHQGHPEQNFAVEALQTNEMARGRALSELLGATQTNLAPGLDQQLLAREKSLRQSLRAKENYRVTLLSTKYSYEQLASLQSDLAQLEKEHQDVSRTIREKYPAYDQLNRPTTLSLTQIQELVVADDETVLLEYSLGAEKSFVWAVTRNSIASAELPPMASVNEAAGRVYELLKATPSQESEPKFTLAAQDLSRMILAPVAAQLHKRRIIVVADGALNYIPFQVLPAASENGQPLIAGHEVINAPSASILGQLRQETARRPAPEKVLAAFGDPVFASNYAERRDAKIDQQVAALQTPDREHWRHALRDVELNGDSFDPSVIKSLSYAKRELAVLQAAAPAGETFVAAGFDATRARLQSTDLTRFAILHIATHGFLDPKRPENSGLVLSTVDSAGHEQNGFVDLQDIYNLHAPVDLVVLSACQTALGKDVRGEGLIGLTRGFMYAGASSVVASLWKVDDEATAELMKQFYSNLLQKGMRPAEALRAAQDTIRQKPEWRAPYYWAAFTLQGEYRQVIRPTSANVRARNVKIALGVTVLLLALAGAWWYRRRRASRVAEA